MRSYYDWREDEVEDMVFGAIAAAVAALFVVYMFHFHAHTSNYDSIPLQVFAFSFTSLIAGWAVVGTIRGRRHAEDEPEGEEAEGVPPAPTLSQPGPVFSTLPSPPFQD